MYPNLSYLLNDFLGTPKDNWFSIFHTYGTVTTLTIFTCAYLLKREIERKELSGEINILVSKKEVTALNYLFYLLVMSFLGYKLGYVIAYLDEFKNAPRQIIFSSLGSVKVAILLDVLYLGYIFLTKKALKTVTTLRKVSELVYEATLFIIVAAMLGAKIIALLESDMSKLNLTSVFNSGVSYYGGLIGGFLGGLFYFYLYKIPVRFLFDTIAPILMLGYAIGRLGCHLSGDGDWGIENNVQKPSFWFLPDWTWSNNFPHNVLNKGQYIQNCVNKYCFQLPRPVYPTSLYESFMALISFLIMWKIRKKTTKPYHMASLFLILNSLQRFFIEFIRVNPKYNIYGLLMSQAQIVAVSLFILAIIWLSVANKIAK